MLRIVIFSLVVNGLITAVLFLSERVFGVPELLFLDDYFFFALLIQWLLSSILLVAKPGRERYLKHSPYKATRAAASMASDADEHENQTNFDVGLSMLLFISGGFSLLACIVL
ncbi:hypothetical protein BIY22_03970 [Vibrio panuliri]|uniref:Uncharacterized protein n=1 Tax=Vibrio panuliri TaxID=1381081 RepID=A0A1Q9HK76_9VIBR|nr:hypothetical protein [Vibrio panuliri]OLQ90706.1 hypothetical protein BIY22_03970 [Vibrio panuliri]